MHSDLPMNSGDIAWKKKTKTIKGVKHIAVLVSPNFGAGWSTWNREFASFLLFDSGIVERVIRDDKDEVETYICEKTKGKAYIYYGGLKDLEVCWIPEGTKFVIDEYDGRETLRTLDNIDYFTA